MADTTIHTTVPDSIKNKLKIYGKGSIKEGIINIVTLLESKSITIIIQTEIII